MLPDQGLNAQAMDNLTHAHKPHLSAGATKRVTLTRSAKHAAGSRRVTEGEPPPGPERAWARNDWIGLSIFAAAAVCTIVWLVILDRGDSFFFDEWDFINLASTTGYWHNVLQPHQGHPSMIPYTIYEVLLRIVGMRHYGPYQAVLLFLDVSCGTLLFLLLRRKIHPIAAGALPALLMLLGPSWQDILWPFQIGFLGSVAGGLGALVLIDRRTRRADIGACICLLASTGCSGSSAGLSGRRRRRVPVEPPGLAPALDPLDPFSPVYRMVRDDREIGNELSLGLDLGTVVGERDSYHRGQPYRSGDDDRRRRGCHPRFPGRGGRDS